METYYLTKEQIDYVERIIGRHLHDFEKALLDKSIKESLEFKPLPYIGENYGVNQQTGILNGLAVRQAFIDEYFAICKIN